MSQGRIHQIEYAMEAVKQGSATVGLKSRTHAVLVALKVLNLTLILQSLSTDMNTSTLITSTPTLMPQLQRKHLGLNTNSSALDRGRSAYYRCSLSSSPYCPYLRAPFPPPAIQVHFNVYTIE